TVCDDCETVIEGSDAALPLDPTNHGTHGTTHHDAKAATCTETGHGAYDECNGCHKATVEGADAEIPINPDNHDWDDGVVTKEATCSAEGEKLFTCKNDKTHTTTEKIAINPDAHKWGEYVYNNDATEEADGTETRKCEYCDKEETRTAEGTKLEPQYPPVDSTEVFTDVAEGKWYTKYIDYVATYGLMNGMSETTFEPSGKLTRAMFVQILANMSGVDTANRDVTTTFTDVPANKWYTPAVKWASENGIVNGISETTFEPMTNIQRQQICVMLVRYAEYAGITLDAKTDEMTFTDADRIQNYAKEAVVICQKAGIIDGMDDKDGNKIFAPRDTATRAQVATMITRFHENFVNVK
ncbi:MAG: S-layer homology domain-containing protein, partial [Clostridia bacterium]|nr:S-layer homology domain-containing protein [Clostridia bacterium]